MIETFLIISAIFNVVLGFYAVRLARRLLTVATNIDAVYQIFDVFREHVEQIHEAEMFYGDQTLQALIEHSKGVLDSLDEYDDLMAMVDVEEDEDAEEEE
tara:strand:- start:361 stop:660 length:300 start_codon:yes stop_codon:yes gene_type:complete